MVSCRLFVAVASLAALTLLLGCTDQRVVRRLPIPDRALLEPAIAAATRSTVKITGSACGLSTAGSGVVVSPHLVLTAAHVVAGATETNVVDSVGGHRAIPVIVDPLSDLAMLYVDALGEAPLAINSRPADRGTVGAVLGYPHAGGLEASAAVVLDSYAADGHDIYGRQSIVRAVLEVQAEILPGSSGGPFVDSTGKLIGMVFGQSEDDVDIGYALTSVAISAVVDEALRLTKEGPLPASTEECLPAGAVGS
jgi:S1-C subfamily serine protease